MGTQLTTYEKELAEAAQRAVANTSRSTGASFLSVRGGTLTYDDAAMPGNQACCVVLGSVYENTYYPERFDPNKPAAPRCYAFSADGRDMVPHESMGDFPDFFKPQSDTCGTCRWSKIGSSDIGKGKACQNRYRLSLLPAGIYSPRRGSRDFDLELFDDPKHYADAEAVFLKLPVMSGKHWAKYVEQVASMHRRPPFGVFTRLYVVPDQRSQYVVNFEIIDVVPDDALRNIMPRAKEAPLSLMRGYSPPQE